ncbi:MAG: hypothetical protein PUE01_10720 [Clostridiaceae bacterium]|nr:hypothetical protein [Clostridiaceae bacterium]
MNKTISRVVSLLLVVLITLLVLDYFKIITFSEVIRKCIGLVTLILTIFSSTTTICISKSGFNKFLNYVIIVSMTAGLLIFTYTGKYNNTLYVALLCTVVYALMDMVIKEPEK